MLSRRFLVCFALLTTASCGGPADSSGNSHREGEALDPAGSSAIANLYQAWGGASGYLGSATSGISPTPDGIGQFQQYQSGAIYWTANTDAHMVFGAIRDEWGDLGWETGFLGYPTEDSAGNPDGLGIFSYFQGGAIYWTPDTGAHEVHGDILKRWGELGWETGSLGYPVSDEMDSSVAGVRTSTFQNGSLFWSQCSGVTDTPQPCTLVSTGDCVSDADCSNGFTCNNAYENSMGWCTGTIDTYAGDPLAAIHWNNGPDYNSCTTNSVVNELQAMEQAAYTQVSYDQRENVVQPPDNDTIPTIGGLAADCSVGGILGLGEALPWDHVQSLVRLPGSSNDRWMAGTIDQHDDSAQGGVMFIDLAQLGGNAGEPFRAGRNDDRGLNKAEAYYQLPAAHPGGMQALGKTLAVAVKRDQVLGQGAIHFIDASNPTGKSIVDALIQKVPVESMVYPPGVDGPGPNSVNGVAVVPLASGGFLLAVNNGGAVWMYLTTYPNIRADTHWYFHNKVNIDNAQGAENMTFVTECDGTVYLLTTGNPEGGSLGENGLGNGVNMHKLVKDGDRLSLAFAANRSSFINDGYADFRASATFYVSPNGEIALYAASRSVVCRQDNFKMAEFVVPDFCGLGGC